MTDFNPEKDEAIMSTRQLDDNYSQKLPELRTTAKKYGRWAPRREQTDIVINTSAIGRAFPGFSDGDSSDDTKSLEVPRAPKFLQRRSVTQAPRAEYSDNLNSSPAVTLGSGIKILNTPPRSYINNASAPQHNTNSIKENIAPMNNQHSTRLSPYISHASRTTNGERRTLAELHAQVADDTNGSFAEDRPATITFQAKNTRFASTHTNTTHPANVSSKRQEADDDLIERINCASNTPSKSPYKPSSKSPSKSQAKQYTARTATSNTHNPTQQSFIIPTMPETTEIMPTSFNKGTGIPLPGMEQDIYTNIDLLQDRVAELENERERAVTQLAETLDRAEHLEKELRQLKQQSSARGEQFKVRMERDQAVSQLSESAKQNEHLEKENRELKKKTFTETQRARMQAELDQALADLDNILNQNKQLEGENRQLKQQSFSESERTKMKVDLEGALAELEESIKKNAHLDSENRRLKRQTFTAAERSKLIMERDQALAQLAESLRENERLKRQVEGMENEMEQRAKFLQEMTADTTETLMEKRKLQERLERHQKAIRKVQDITTQSFKERQRTKTKTQHAPIQSLTKGEEGLQTQPEPTQSFDLHDLPNESFKQIEPSIDTSFAGFSEDSSEYASILGTGFLDNLRQKEETIHSNASHRRRHSEPSVRAEQDQTIQSITSRRRQHSETSVHTRTTRRRRTETDDITSAFIIPDISFNVTTVEKVHPTTSAEPATTEKVHPTLSANARRVLDDLCKHDCQNCTVCTRVASFDTKNHTKHKVTIPKPVPVSERMPDPTPYEDEPTIRPSIEPGLALATVIKGLGDEIAHLKLEHARVTKAYGKHDPSLGMRHRKSLKQRMDQLVLEIERKSDQLYGLYDVLEGQKSDQGLDDELPWEGIHDE
jgi:hypothetical protein